MGSVTRPSSSHLAAQDLLVFLNALHGVTQPHCRLVWCRMHFTRVGHTA